MYNTPPPNLLQGIQLVQAGRKAEALPYLRYAARTEPLTADGWLWLACATDDREEYRNCVQQALALDPQHPTALRMRDELDRQERWGRATPTTGTGFPPVPAPAGAPVYGPGYVDADYRPEHRRWGRTVPALLLGLICLLLVISVVVIGPIKVGERLGVVDTGEIVEFTVGMSGESYRFRVLVPDSWLPADTESGDWQARRVELMDHFDIAAGQPGVWDEVDEPFNTIMRDPVYGTILPPARLVETDPETLDRYGVITALTLQEIVPLPDVPDRPGASVCDRMRLLEDQLVARGGLNSTADSEVTASGIGRRGDIGDCVLYVQRRTTASPPFALDDTPGPARVVTLAVPVGRERYALWVLTMADAAYDEDRVDRIIGSLEYLD